MCEGRFIEPENDNVAPYVVINFVAIKSLELKTVLLNINCPLGFFVLQILTQFVYRLNNNAVYTLHEKHLTFSPFKVKWTHFK